MAKEAATLNGLIEDALMNNNKSSLAMLQDRIENRVFNDTELKQLKSTFVRSMREKERDNSEVLIQLIQLFIETNTEKVGEWLYPLIQQVVRRLSYGQVKTHIQALKEISCSIRENFESYSLIDYTFKFVMDNHKISQSEVKIQLLEFIRDILPKMNDTPAQKQDFFHKLPAQFAMGIPRIISWTADVQSSKVRRASSRLILRLYELDPDCITRIVRPLPSVFHQRIKDVLNDISVPEKTQTPDRSTNTDNKPQKVLNTNNCDIRRNTFKISNDKNGEKAEFEKRIDDIKNKKIVERSRINKPSNRDQSIDSGTETFSIKRTKFVRRQESSSDDSDSTLVSRTLTASRTSAYNLNRDYDCDECSCSRRDRERSSRRSIRGNERIEFDYQNKYKRNSSIYEDEPTFSMRSSKRDYTDQLYSITSKGEDLNERRKVKTKKKPKANIRDTLSSESLWNGEDTLRSKSEISRNDKTKRKQKKGISKVEENPVNYNLEIDEIIKQLFHPGSRIQSQSTILISFINLIHENRRVDWNVKFIPTLNALLETLSYNEGSIRKLSVVCIQELVKIQPKRFHDVMFQVVEKLIKYYMDNDNGVVEAVQSCMIVFTRCVNIDALWRTIMTLLIEEISLENPPTKKVTKKSNKKVTKVLFSYKQLTALRFLRATIKEANPIVVRILVGETAALLNIFSVHEDIRFRKWAIFCLVEIYKKVENKLWPHLKEYSQQKVKLIQMYVKRSM